MNTSTLTSILVIVLSISTAKATNVITQHASDLYIECDGAGNLFELNTWLNDNGGAMATSTCNPIVWTNDYVTVFPGCGATGFTTVTFTATDACNDFVTTTATFTIEDTTTPIFYTVPVDETVECDGSGNVSELQSWLQANGGAFADDVCSNVYWTNDFSYVSDNCGETGSTTVTFTATDDCGNYSTGDATFTIEDTTDPIIDVGATDLNLECDSGNHQAAIDAWLSAQGGASSSDVCSTTALVWTNDYVSGDENTSCGASGSVVVFFSVTDDCGFYSTDSATITISDTTAPSINTSAQDQTVTCDGSGNITELNTWLANYAGAVATDACSGVVWTNDYAGGPISCGPAGAVLVNFTATDDCGNYSSTSATFTATQSSSGLTITTSASDLSLECDQVNNFSQINIWLLINGGAAATTNCSGSSNITWTNNYITGSHITDCGATGSVLVVFTATDNCGDSATTAATITIIDSTAPTIIAIANDETVECDGSGNLGALNAWLSTNAGASATDECSNVTWTNDFTVLSDDCGESGSTTVVFTATDDCDNYSTTSATFTIEDTTNPSIDYEASDLFLECDTFSHQTAIDAWLSYNGGAVASDVCSGTGVIWSHDYIIGDENTSCGATGSVLVTFTAVDHCGLSATTTAIITIEDTTTPTILSQAQDETVACDGSGNVTQLQAWLSNNGGASASDACSSVVWTHDYPGGPITCGASGSVLVTFEATDECGLSSTTSATFTATQSSSGLSINTLASDITLECDLGSNLSSINTWLLFNGGASATTNCNGSNITWTNDYTTGSENTACGATGSVVVIFTATDNCGDSATTAATISIEDTTPPTIVSEASHETVECGGNGNFNQLDWWLSNNGGAAAIDECSNVTWSNDFTLLSDDCGSTGEALVTFTATDDCGNYSYTSATFTIEDTTVPSIDIPASDLNLECDAGAQQAAIDAWLYTNGGAQASDICNTTDIIWSNNYAVGDENTDCGESGSVLVTFTATDECGLFTTVSATISVEDTTLPIILQDAFDETVECDGNGNTSDLNTWLAYNGGAAAADVCGDITWTNNFVGLTDDCGQTGSILVVFEVTDECGNIAQTDATFTIEDTTGPFIDEVAADETVVCDGAGNVSELQAWLANNGGAVASDLCSTVTWTNDYIGPLVCGTAGAIFVTFTATDECGLVDTTSATFTAEDSAGVTINTNASDLNLECDIGINADDIDIWLTNNGGTEASGMCNGSTDVIWTNDFVPGAFNQCGDTGALLVIFTATDNCGNQPLLVQQSLSRILQRLQS